MNSLLSVEISGLAERIMTLAEQQAVIVGQDTELDANSESLDVISDAMLADVASRELARRAVRARYLPADFFSEGGWAILLDLFANEHRLRPVSIKSACIASGVPATTALRCIEALISYGLISRSEGQNDRRFKLLCLTNSGRVAMRIILRQYIR